jgi:hypothetical protein
MCKLWVPERLGGVARSRRELAGDDLRKLRVPVSRGVGEVPRHYISVKLSLWKFQGVPTLVYILLELLVVLYTSSTYKGMGAHIPLIVTHVCACAKLCAPPGTDINWSDMYYFAIISRTYTVYLGG